MVNMGTFIAQSNRVVGTVHPLTLSGGRQNREYQEVAHVFLRRQKLSYF